MTSSAHAVSVGRSPLSIAIVFACVASAVHAQAPDPLDSSKVLELTSFATFTTLPGSGAMDLDHPRDGTGRVFVSTMEGKVWGFSSTGAPLGIFLDLAAPGVAPDFNSNLEFAVDGLAYSAFHPDYGRPGASGEGKFYTYHETVVPGLRTPDYSAATLPTRPGDVLTQYTITEWTVDAVDGDRIDPESRREVLRLEFSGPSTVMHCAGSIAFDPFTQPGDEDHGLLHVPTGDMWNSGGVPNWQHVQDLDNPFGKILRIDPLESGAEPYAVPASNPFADGGSLLDADGTTEEIYAWGFRNPQNMSFARDADGESRMLVFDIGADDYEELNLVDVGDNHGWPAYDGPTVGNPATVTTLPLGATLEFPATVFDHVIPDLPGAAATQRPTAIVGGFVVSDPNDPTFTDQAIFGCLNRGAIFHAGLDDLIVADGDDSLAPLFVMAVSVDGSAPGLFADLIGQSRGDTRFGVDEAGRLFVVTRRIDTVFVTNMVAQPTATSVAPGPRVGLAGAVRLVGATPNPFNPSTEIELELAEAGRVTLEVFDVAGRLVRTIDGGMRRAGRSVMRWDGTDAGGRPAASGRYLVRARSGGASDAASVVLVK